MLNSVLIVEDDPAIRTMLAAIAMHACVAPVPVGDGASALHHLRRNRFDALILDLLLPVVNGFEIIRHLKNTNPDLLNRTVVITAASATTLRGAGDLDLVRCVQRKPIDIRTLVSEIRGCCADSARRNVRVK